MNVSDLQDSDVQMHPVLIINGVMTFATHSLLSRKTFWNCSSACTVSEEEEWMGNNIPNFSLLRWNPESMWHHLRRDITDSRLATPSQWACSFLAGNILNILSTWQTPFYFILTLDRCQQGGSEEMQTMHFPLFEYSLWSSCWIFYGVMI